MSKISEWEESFEMKVRDEIDAEVKIDSEVEEETLVTAKKDKRHSPGSITSELIAANLERFNGNLAAVAQFLKCSRSTIYRRIAADDELRNKVADQRESTLDELEEELFSQALNGNIAALIFALKTQGHKRGYIEGRKVQIDGKWTSVKERDKLPEAEAKHLAAVLEELENLSESEASEAELEASSES